MRRLELFKKMLPIAGVSMALLLCGCSKAETKDDLWEKTEQEEPVAETEATDEASEKAESPEDTSAEEFNIYREYSKIVEAAQPTEWDGFQLIDLDGDGTPELFATCTNEQRPDPGMQPYMIVGHNAEGIVVNDELADGVASAGGYRGTLYYLEGVGKLHDSAAYAPLHEPSDTIYALKDGKIDVEVYGGFEVDRDADLPEGDFDILEYGNWSWDNQEVTQDEYAQKLREATDNTVGKEMYNIEYMDKESMLKELESRF